MEANNRQNCRDLVFKAMTQFFQCESAKIFFVLKARSELVGGFREVAELPAPQIINAHTPAYVRIYTQPSGSSGKNANWGGRNPYQPISAPRMAAKMPTLNPPM